MTNNYKPSHMPDLIAYLVARDVAASIDFYQKAFGFEVIDIAKNDKDIALHAEMKKGNAVIMFGLEGAVIGNTNKTPATLGITSPVSIYVYCKNVDELYKQAMDNGADSMESPNDAFWGDRFCKLIDLDGYEWLFATLIQ